MEKKAQTLVLKSFQKIYFTAQFIPSSSLIPFAVITHYKDMVPIPFYSRIDK